MIIDDHSYILDTSRAGITEVLGKDVKFQGDDLSSEQIP